MSREQEIRDELDRLRAGWDMESVAAQRDLVSFVLNKARRDYLKVTGQDGIALARYQAEVLRLVKGIGTQAEIRRAERTRARRIIVDAFGNVERDTVAGVLAAEVISEVTGKDLAVTLEELETDSHTLTVDHGPETLRDDLGPVPLVFGESPVREIGIVLAPVSGQIET